LVIAVVFLSLTGVFPSGLIETKVSAAKITENYQFDSRIRLNSIGFIPNHSKKATIAANCSTFYVVKEDGTIVYTGTATSMFDNDTKETVILLIFHPLMKKERTILPCRE